jgi:hypothetical protein
MVEVKRKKMVWVIVLNRRIFGVLLIEVGKDRELKWELGFGDFDVF